MSLASVLFMVIGILGCGWLGRPLAASLVEHHRVIGTTTTADKMKRLEALGIEPVLYELNSEQTNLPNNLRDVEKLVLTLPPDRGAEQTVESQRRRVESFLEALKQHGSLQHLLYTSSTGVYPNENRTVVESEVPPGAEDGAARLRSSAQAVRVAEGLIAQSGIPYTILRLAGLYGPDRHPARFFAGRSGVPGASVPVNMVHLNDVVGVLLKAIAAKPQNEVYNVCADAHPTRSEFYVQAAKSAGMAPPTFDDQKKQDYKVVSNTKVKRAFGYVFSHADPMNDFTDPV